LNTNDQLILEAILSGEERKRDWALYQFYSDPEIRGWVSSYISHHGGQDADAEDVFQDSIIILDRNIRNGKFEGKSTLKTYLLSIVKWSWLTSKRKKGYHDEFKPEFIYDIEESVEFELISEEKKMLVENAIDQVDERCQSLLRYYKLDYSMKEIMSKMGFSSPEMAKKQAYRCRERLRAYFLSQPELLRALNIYIS